MKFCPPDPNQTGHPQLPAISVAAPGPHLRELAGPLLQDQNCGSGLNAGPLRQPHPYYSTNTGPRMWREKMKATERGGTRIEKDH